MEKLGTDPFEDQPDGIFWQGFHDEHQDYPLWLYHKNGIRAPVLVENAEEEAAAEQQGYFRHQKRITNVPTLFNWRFDLEDYTARQLAQFVKDEFELDLPVELGKEKLFKYIWELHVARPENRDRVVLMAHSVRMDYDNTVKRIKEMEDKMPIVEKRDFYA